MSAAHAKVPAHGLAHRQDAVLRPSRAAVAQTAKERRLRLAGQLALDFGTESRRLDVRQALLEVGQDPRPDERYRRSRVCQRAVHAFPQGMTLAEVGFVLGMHKQSVKKVEDRALAKVAAAFGLDAETLRDTLRAADGRRDHWDAMGDES